MLNGAKDIMRKVYSNYTYYNDPDGDYNYELDTNPLKTTTSTTIRTLRRAIFLILIPPRVVTV